MRLLDVYLTSEMLFRCVIHLHCGCTEANISLKLTAGLHVVVTMFSGYLVGYAAFRALFSHNPVMVPYQ